MRIVCNGHPVLRKKAAVVEALTPDVLSFAERLKKSLQFSEIEGVGLAAPQVGVSRRMVVIDTRPPKNTKRPEPLSPGEIALEPLMPVVLVNPEIVGKSVETAAREEGCLSLPGVSAVVTRPVSVTLKAQLLDGQQVLLECSNLLGRCLQHEIDHLDGILFIDHASQAEKDEAAFQMRKLAKEERRRLAKQNR